MRRPFVVPVAVLALLVAAPFVALVPRFVERQRYAAVHDACRDIPMAPVVTPQSAGYLWPFGAVYACRALGGGAPFLGRVDASFALLLETDKGPVVGRMDVTHINAGRRYSASVTEMSPEDAGLPPEEVQRIRQAVSARGGLNPYPWIVRYGDG
jgi:hypothetical protein